MRGKFKKCPFCGNEAGIRDVYGVIDWTEDCEPVTRRMFVCECKGEECWVSPVTDEFYTEEEAIEAWNRRSEGAIKALERESMLDKIRAEIAEPTNASSNRDYDEGWEDAVKRDLRIFDKYQTESEVEK